MVCKKVQFSETGFFSPLFLDYLAEAERLADFYSYRPDTHSAGKALEEIKRYHFGRKLISTVLAEQNPDMNQLAEKLLDENTFTVCTGHQLCLFTGPLYFIYKIVSTINLAEELKAKHPGCNFIPVYWMAGEDHDIEEINHINIFGKKLEWKTKTGGPAGRLPTHGIEDVIKELDSMMGDTPHAKELVALFSAAYASNKNMAEATRHLVRALFSEYELLVLDADDKRLKKQFSKAISDDIFNHTNQRLVHEASVVLKSLGYESQVNPREINLFYLQDGVRKRIDKAEEKFRKELEDNPERFSPNVVLRPLYQQMLLPNVAYVGGAAEISYWLQYKKMFAHHGVFYPMLIPRNSVLWIDERSAEQIKKLGISEDELFGSADALQKRYLQMHSAPESSLLEEHGKLDKIFSAISAKAQQLDATLKHAAEAEQQKTLNALKNLEQKMLKAEKQKHETALNQLRKLKEKLFAEGGLQERHDNFIPFYLKHGKEFICTLKRNLDPFDLRFVIVSEN